MKFAVTKEALLDGLQRIQNVVSTRSTLPVLTNALLETTKTGLRLTTTDLEVAIRCEIVAQVDKAGATTLPARRLSAIVRELPASEITRRDRRQEHLNPALRLELFQDFRPRQGGVPGLSVLQGCQDLHDQAIRAQGWPAQDILCHLGG